MDFPTGNSTKGVRAALDLTGTETKQSVVFIDANVDDYQSLLKGVNPGVEAVLLGAHQDGIQQITDVLTQRYSRRSTPEFLTVHIVSHGAPGCLSLGNAQLSLDTFEKYAEALASWGEIAPERSLLIYGCNVAAGDAGAQWLQTLHQLTGANIAASVKRTGSARLGGNWHLETQVGNITAPLAFTTATTDAYASAFALNASDLVVAGYSADNPDSFALLALADIPAGETVTISDRGLRVNGTPSTTGNDQDITWVIPAAIPAGTIIQSGSIPANLNLNANGDQILIYQTGPTYISAFNNDLSQTPVNSWSTTFTNNNATRSVAPPGTTVVTIAGGPGNAFGLVGETDNAYYNGPTTPATKDGWIARINEPGNWVRDNDNSINLAAVLPTAFLVDQTPPNFNSIVRQDPSTGSTNADVLVFRATFNEGVQNVDASDFVVTGVSGVSVSTTVTNNATYDIVVFGGDLANFDGTVGLNLAPGQNIQDLPGNNLPNTEPAIDETFTVDNTPAPTPTPITPPSPGPLRPIADPAPATPTVPPAILTAAPTANGADLP
ncbi:MAG: DUF4347 domain-containing protein, partial [Cyanophyceae cyanobacterium]